jgi:hypothetical protein
LIAQNPLDFWVDDTPLAGLVCGKYTVIYLRLIIVPWGWPKRGGTKRVNLCRAYFGVPRHQGEIQCRLKVIELAVHAPQLRADVGRYLVAKVPHAQRAAPKYAKQHAQNKDDHGNSDRIPNFYSVARQAAIPAINHLQQDRNTMQAGGARQASAEGPRNRSVL